jgi:hypothetical protein
MAFLMQVVWTMDTPLRRQRRGTAWMRHHFAAMFLGIAAAVSAQEPDTTVPVTIAEDIVDGDVGSVDSLLANPGPDGGISLREAILASNASEGRFEFAWFCEPTQPETELPPLKNPQGIVLVPGDGSDNRPYLRGGKLPAGSALFRVESPNNLFVAAIFGECNGSGLVFSGPDAKNNLVRRSVVAKNDIGLVIEDGASENLIGGNNDLDGNDIGRNRIGLSIRNADNNIIQGNRFTAPFGSPPYNRNIELALLLENATGNLIGGDEEELRGNFMGLERTSLLVRGGGRNLIQGNRNGGTTGAFTFIPFSTHGPGIVLEGGTHDNIVGGTVPGLGNIIVGNTSDGDPNVEPAGIIVQGAGTDNNVVLGNYIGSDWDYEVYEDWGNEGPGIVVRDGARGTVIGGIGPGTGNRIRDNGGGGIVISGAATTGTIITGNEIGHDASTGLDVGNHGPGVFLDGAAEVLVGGETAEAANVIMHNDRFGVVIAPDASACTVRGNAISGNQLGGILSGDESCTTPGLVYLLGMSPAHGVAPAESIVDLYVDAAGQGEVFVNRTVAGNDGTFAFAEDGTGYPG